MANVAKTSEVVLGPTRTQKCRWLVPFWLIAGLFLFSTLSTATAATYYVDTVNGNNSFSKAQNDLAHPWKTIQRATWNGWPNPVGDVLAAGDTLYVRAGIYREMAKVNVNGTAEDPIIIKAYPGETPIVTGCKLITGWTQCDSNEPGLTINGVTNSNYANIYKAQIAEGDVSSVKLLVLLENRQLLFMSQEPDQTYTVPKEPDEYWPIPNEGGNYGQKTYIIDSTNLTQADDFWNNAFVQVYDNSDGMVVANKVTIADFNATNDKITFSAPTSITLAANDRYSILNHPLILDKPGEYYCTTTAVGGEYTVYLWPYDTTDLTEKIDFIKEWYSFDMTSDYITLDGFETYGNQVISIRMGQGGEQHVTIRNCTVHDSLGYGIDGADISYAVVEDCNIYRITNDAYGNAHGIALTAGCDNAIIRNNTIDRTDHSNILTYSMNIGQITGNTVGNSGPHGSGITMYEGPQNLLIANNIVTNEHACFIMHGNRVGVPVDAGQITFYNNIAYNATSHKIGTWSEFASGRIVILNNVLAAPDDFTGSVIYGEWGIPLIVKNNILAKARGIDGNDLRDYNIYTQPSACQLSEHESLQEETDVFADFANQDFTLKTSSPAINAGVDINSLLPTADFPDFNFGIDIVGKPRISAGRIDIGCYEYVESDPNNHVPVLETIGNKPVDEGSTLVFDVNATDPDGDDIIYSCPNLPSRADFTGQTFTWTPDYNQAGHYEVTFIASDGNNQDSETITITVNNTNRAPELTSIGDKSISENSALSFTASATDADNDDITYSATGLPDGAGLTGQDFGWTPGYDQTGTYQVTFTASDGTDSDSETITITVNNTNRAPVLASIGDKSISENETSSFSISATDADSDNITYSAEDLPSGAAFAGQMFAWTPGYDQAGLHNVTFIAADGQAQDSEIITITVSNTNRSPVLDSIGDKSVYTEDTLTFSVNASDLDGDTIRYSATGLPSGATFASQSFSWTPNSSQAGSYDITFTADDNEAQDSEAITITVTADSTAPSVTGLSPAADSIQVPLNSLISLSVSDDGKGVDATTVTIEVNGNLVYTGNTTDYNSPYGHCRRTGNSASYRYFYQADETFDYDQSMTVTVNATDLAGNAMSEYSYSFNTEMRSFGQNERVSKGTNNLSASTPATASDSGGNIWAVWHAGQEGSRDIYVGKLAAGADSFGNPVKATSNDADQCNPVIAIDGADKLYVAWQDNRQGEWDIYVSTSTDGTIWSAERKITDPNSNQTNPVMAVDGSNKAYIAWVDDRNGNNDIYIASSSNNFASSTAWQVTYDSSDQSEPAIAVDSSNTVYVVWTDARAGTSDIYGADSANGPWTNVAVVNKQSNQTAPSIAAEASGSVLHLLWVDDVSGDNDIYYASTSGLPGSPLSGSNLVDDDSGADQSAPALITTGSTGGNLKVFACWQDERNVFGNNGDTDIYFVQVNSGSGTNILVGDDGTNSAQSAPAIGIDGYGHPCLVWTDGRSTSADIYYAGSTFVEPTALQSEDITASLGMTVGKELANINSATDVSVIVPAGACSYDVKIAVSTVKNPQKVTLDYFSTRYEFGPSGIEFDEPVTIIIPYDVSVVGNSPSVYWYNSLLSSLSQEGITNIETIQISSSLYALRFKTTHFTQFLVGGIAAAVGGGGGGGGGCSMLPDNQGGVIEFLLPYLVLAVVMVILKSRDRRNRKAHTATESKF